MEIALHLRSSGQVESFEGVPAHLTALYEPGTLSGIEKILPLRVRRLYAGDEFCPNRLPSPKELEELLDLAASKKWAVSLLTPPLTDEGLDRCLPLFEQLRSFHHAAEVVVNDWGVLLALQERVPGLTVGIGRLLNKGFKDPRLQDPERFARHSQEAKELLNQCTFDSPLFQERAARLGVRRLERDLLPYGKPRVALFERLGVSVYAPFGYFTTGRVCWAASVHRPSGKKFSLGGPCDRLCERLPLGFDRSESGLATLQNGNSFFYLYPQALLASFLRWARRRRVRLVYQGLAIAPHGVGRGG
jgi:hypothetical protein